MQGNILVLQAKTILSQNQSCRIEVGIIDDLRYLTNVTLSTNLNITIITGNAEIFKHGGILYLRPYSLGTLILKLTYNESGQNIGNYFSLWVIPQATYPQFSDITNTLLKYLYQNVYSQSQESVVYSKNFATGSVFADIYDNVYQTFLTLYPPFTTDSAWEEELNNNYPWTNSTYYNLVIQELNNIPLYSANLYNITFLITEYIYARLGQSLYVYVQETYTNPSNSWVLGYSTLGQNTILAVDQSMSNSVIVHIQIGSLPSEFLTELGIFIDKILPADVNNTIELNPDFGTTFGLNINVPDVYPEDPRLYLKYALLYNPNKIYDAEALISPYNPAFLSKLTILPPDQSSFPSNQASFNITATAIYTYNGIDYSLDVTEQSTYSSDDPSVIQMQGSTALIMSSGSAKITANYLADSAAATYNILDVLWILGSSDLDTTTVLG